MTSKDWWRLCLAAGFIVIVIQVAMGTTQNTEPCGPAGGLPSILAFELVRGPEDVAALFGDDPCRSRLVEAMNRINMIDAWAFIPAFVSYLVLGALAVRAHGRTIASLAIITAIAAGLCDEAEDQILLNITGDLPGTQVQIAWLFWLVRAKFALLGISPILIGILLFMQGRLEKFLGVVMIVGGAIAVIGTLGTYILLGPGIAITWIALLMAAMRNSIQRTDSSTLSSAN